MANEHIRTAAANLQRAAQDVRESEHRLQNDIEDLKRNAADAVKKAEQQIDILQHSLYDRGVPDSSKLAVGLQLHNLHSDIARIKKDSAQREQSLRQQLSSLSGQENEFNNLASHLNNIA